MKSQPYHFNGAIWTKCEPAEATHLEINLPGPTGSLRLPIILKGPRRETPNWTWNGSVDQPTLKPSVLNRSGHYSPHFKKEDTCWCEYRKNNLKEAVHFSCYICHVYINDGNVQFLGDCTHEFKGKTIPLLDVK